jgi:hypothetical protein
MLMQLEPASTVTPVEGRLALAGAWCLVPGLQVLVLAAASQLLLLLLPPWRPT